MNFDEISVYCELHRDNQDCMCINLQNINDISPNCNNESEKDSIHKRNPSSITRQCFAAIIGKFALHVIIDYVICSLTL